MANVKSRHSPAGETPQKVWAVFPSAMEPGKNRLGSFHRRWRTKKGNGQACIVDGEQKKVTGRLASSMEIRQKHSASIHRRWKVENALGEVASLME